MSRKDVYLLNATSSHNVHKKAIEELREMNFKSLRTVVLELLAKVLEIKPSLLHRNFIIIHYRNEKEGPLLKHKHVIAPNDGSYGFGGFSGFFLNAPTGNPKTTAQNDAPTVNSINLPAHLPEIYEFLTNDKNVLMEGIFIKIGSRKYQEDIIEMLKLKKTIEFQKEGFTVYDCANVLKQFLQQLKEPLFVPDYFAAYEIISELEQKFEVLEHQRVTHNAQMKMNGRLITPDSELRKREQQIIDGVQLIVQLMPPQKREFLKNLMEILRAIYINRAFNNASSTSLAAIFTSLLMCPRSLPRSVSKSAAQSLSFLVNRMIKMGKDVFDSPRQLQDQIWDVTRGIRSDPRGDKILIPKMKFIPLL